MPVVTFSHDNAGTPESAWFDAGVEDLPPLGDGIVPGPGERLIVMAAHPDDESLGAAGLIHVALHGGAVVHVVVCTAGEASHPRSPTHTPAQLAERRMQELDAALQLLRDTALEPAALTWRHLTLPDGQLAQHSYHLDAAIQAAVEQPLDDGLPPHDITRTVIAAPYRLDAHPDHEAVGSAAARAATRYHLGLLEFPIWFWHWAEPRHPAWHHWYALPLGLLARDAKRAVLATHASQILPLSSAVGDEVLLSEGFQDHFRRATETFRWTAPGLRDSSSSARIFDDLYRRSPDPWDYLGSAYEHRKRAVTLAALPRDHYESAIEAGCSIGVLTAGLAERCSHVLGIDASQVALDAAGQHLADAGNVSLLRAELPAGWPALPSASVDLVILSEIGYFLAADEFQTLLQRAAVALQPGGVLLLCHWLHPIDGWELSGQAVHDMARSLGWKQVVEHREEDFLLEIFRAPGGGDA